MVLLWEEVGGVESLITNANDMKKKINFERWWLVIDNWTSEPLAWYETYQNAKASIKYRYTDDCTLVRAVCEIYDNGDASPWSCGKTWAECERNYRNGIIDNFKVS